MKIEQTRETARRPTIAGATEETMGRTSTPTYRVEFKDNTSGHYWNQQSWDCRQDGTPTEANLEQWRIRYNASFQSDGINFHCSKSLGKVIHISEARLVRQATGQIVVATRMPMFEVV